MSDNYFSIVTDLGTKKMLEAMKHGKKLNITHFAVGDGGGAYFEPSADITQLKNEIWRGTINSCEISKEENILIIGAVIPFDVGDFTIREMGIIDEDGVLIAICNTPDTQKVTITDGVVHELSLFMELALSNADVVQLLVDTSIVTATKKDLETKLLEHNTSEEAHADIRKSITDLTQEKMHLQNGFYIHQADGGNDSLNGYIHFASIELLHTATAADISMPITFEVIGSDYKSPITIIVTFDPYYSSSNMTSNAKLKAIYYDNNTNAVDLFAQTIYYTPPIRKNKINLYIQKKTKATMIYITDFKSSYDDSTILSVSFTNEFLQTKPTGSAVKDAVFQLNANTLCGYSASSFLPTYSSGNKVVRANGFDVNIYDDDNEYPKLDSELKIRLGRIDMIKYTNALNKNKSVGVLSKDKIEFNADNIAIKALPDNNLGDGVKGSLALSIAGIKVFDFGNEQISYIRPIGKSPSLLLKDTSTLSTPNHNIFLVNDFGGDYADLDSNVQAPEYRMICGVNVKNAYLGEIDKSYMSLYRGGSFDLKALKTGIAVIGDYKEVIAYANSVRMGKKGDYFIECSTNRKTETDYAYTVKFRNGKGAYLSLGNKIAGNDGIIINGDVKFVDEGDVNNFNNVSDKDKQWLLGDTLQKLLIDLHNGSVGNMLPLSGGTMSNNAIIYMNGNGTLISLSYENYLTQITSNRIDLQDSFNRLMFYSKVTGEASGCGIEAYDKSNGIKGVIRFYNGNIYCEPHDRFEITLQDNKLLSYTFDGTALWAFSNTLDLGKSTYKWRNIYATNGTIQTSDRTQKKDINSLETQKAQEFINGLNPVSYKMLDGTSGRTHYGFIAQDVEELIIQLGMDSKDFAGFIKSPKKIIKYEDENGKKLENPIEEVLEGEYDYALRYDEFIAPLIKVVQEQQKMIEEQQRIIESQQKEIEQIKKEISKIYSSM